MKIFHYWARLEGEATLPTGKKASFFAWGGSRSSQEEAEEDAAAKIKRIAERVLFDRGFPEKYAYGDRPLREEVLREYFDASGNLAAAITRNSYGAAVLNTGQVAFLDVDLPVTRGVSSFAAAAARWLRREPAPDPSAAAAPALERLDTWLRDHPAWGARIYRTRSGLRYLITHETFSPDDAELRLAMEALGVDPQYRRLCNAQKSFRARLTPKPWRMGIPAPPRTFPRTTDAQEEEMRTWLELYNDKAQTYATCRFVRAAGNPDVDSTIEPFVELHDRVTRAEVDLPLA